MAPRAEVIAFNCRGDDLAVFQAVARSRNLSLRMVSRQADLAREAIARDPLAVVLGITRSDQSGLEMVPVIRAARAALPVIVVAEEDSLDLERRAREKDIFYYLVHPVVRPEVAALLGDLLRGAGMDGGPATPAA